jgi:hypothetical protein
MTSISIYIKLESLPKDLKQEVADFVDFLVEKSSKGKEKPISQLGSAKGKIWMSPDFDAPLELKECE